jgi:hypothetical protein
MRLRALGLMAVVLGCGGAEGPPPQAASAPSETPALSVLSVPLAPMGATKMGQKLQDKGLDLANLPRMAELDKATLKAVMPAIALSVGMACGDCHKHGDFAAPTEMKAVAAGMWDHFVHDLAQTDGAPLFCDSCHHGQRKLANRGDPQALKLAMDATYVHGLKRKDAVENTCATCHGEPFQPRLETTLWHARK